MPVDVKLTQLVRLTKGGEPVKMSKRSGTFVTLRDVVDEVGADVTRFVMLTRKNDAPLDFDFDRVTSVEGHSVCLRAIRLCPIVERVREGRSHASRRVGTTRFSRTPRFAVARKASLMGRASSRSRPGNTSRHRVGCYSTNWLGLPLWEQGQRKPACVLPRGRYAGPRAGKSRCHGRWKLLFPALGILGVKPAGRDR